MEPVVAQATRAAPSTISLVETWQSACNAKLLAWFVRERLEEWLLHGA